MFCYSDLMTRLPFRGSVKTTEDITMSSWYMISRNCNTAAHVVNGQTCREYYLTRQKHQSERFADNLPTTAVLRCSTYKYSGEITYDRVTMRFNAHVTVVFPVPCRGPGTHYSWQFFGTLQLLGKLPRVSANEHTCGSVSTMNRRCGTATRRACI